jgi:hypothetical protein
MGHWERGNKPRQYADLLARDSNRTRLVAKATKTVDRNIDLGRLILSFRNLFEWSNSDEPGTELDRIPSIVQKS